MNIDALLFSLWTFLYFCLGYGLGKRKAKEQQLTDLQAKFEAAAYDRDMYRQERDELRHEYETMRAEYRRRERTYMQRFMDEAAYLTAEFEFVQPTPGSNAGATAEG